MTQPEPPDLIISQEVFTSLPPLYQSLAKLLEKEHRVRIQPEADAR